jgi:hypothetical protein
VLRVFSPAAGAYLLDRAAKFVVEGATRPGIVAQPVEFIPEALGFGIRSARVVAQNGVRCRCRLMGSRRGVARNGTRADRSYGRFLAFCLPCEEG